MQPLSKLKQWLEVNTNTNRYLYTFHDLRALCQEQTDAAFKTLLSRAVRLGVLTRVCRGIYLNKKAMLVDGLLLFHVAALLRANEFNYISLETALSDAGVISQVPINWITIMSSGRSHMISCGEFGSIEFVHTDKKPTELIRLLSYDHERGMWRAHVALALKDMKATHRNCDLINWDVADEFI